MSAIGNPPPPIAHPEGLHTEQGTVQGSGHAQQGAGPNVLPTQRPQHVPGGARRPTGPAVAPLLDPNGLYQEGRTSAHSATV